MSGLPESILAFYAALPQQGPGSDRDSDAALELVLPHLRATPAVADLGSGTGRSALYLAERLGVRVTAVEREPLFCFRLAQHAAACDLAALIDICCADMRGPPLAPASLDLLWSEGAAYAIGVDEALSRWRPLLRPGGFCALSECSWLKPERPAAVRRFFGTVYPAMRDIDANIAAARALGYEALATHVVSDEGWSRYYGPIRDALRSGAADHLELGFVRELREELAVYEQADGSFGYVFYVLQRTG